MFEEAFVNLGRVEASARAAGEELFRHNKQYPVRRVSLYNAPEWSEFVRKILLGYCAP
jgi:hypothetical protein